MDINYFDIEFFDFENATEEEIKEIHAILKAPGNNGSVELPWENTLKGNCTVSLLDHEENTVEKTDLSANNTKCQVSMVGQNLHFTASQASSPHPPVMETFVAPPTSPYPPYLVSRTIPYLRAYPHMPFFACPMPGEGSPYGQFVPVVPTAQDKFIGPTSGPSQKNRHHHRRLKKKSSSDYSSSSFESETVSDTYREVATLDGSAGDRPTSVPIVPLPVPPSTFGGPLHGYPPGLLPYPPGPQAASPMYYVPVFNHPYSSYLPSPSAPMVLPVNLPTDAASVVSSSSSTVCDTPAKTSEIVQPNEEAALSDSSSDYPNSKSSSPDYIADGFYSAKCDDVKREDSSRCWADLFKKPPRVNDHQGENCLGKSDLFTNGDASTSDVH